MLRIRQPFPFSPAQLPARQSTPEQAGSLFSLNQVAVGLALRLWEDLVAGRVRESVWLHLEDGVPSLQRVQAGRNAACPLCAQAGRGEEGLIPLHQIFPEGGYSSGIEGTIPPVEGQIP